MSITRRQSKTGLRYLVQVRDASGEFFERRSFSTRAQAVAYQAECLRNKDKPGGAKSLLRKYTVSEYWKRWVHDRQKQSSSWAISQNQMWRDHIEPIIGHLALIEVQSKHIGAVMSFCEKKGLGGQTRRHVFKLMKQLFGDAVEYFEMIEVNPVKLKFQPKVIKRDVKYLKPDEALFLMEQVRDHHFGPAIWVMLLIALRIGELQALRRRNIDFDAGQVVIDEQWNEKLKAWGPLKNGKAVTLPLPPRLREYLLERGIDRLAPDAFVVTGTRGAGRVPRTTISTHVNDLCHGLKLPGLTLHGFRHSSTELWFMAGCNQEDVRRLLNHSSEHAIRAYIHESEKRLTEISKHVGLVNVVPFRKA
jgi:integrase